MFITTTEVYHRGQRRILAYVVGMRSDAHVSVHVHKAHGDHMVYEDYHKRVASLSSSDACQIDRELADAIEGVLLTAKDVTLSVEDCNTLFRFGEDLLLSLHDFDVPRPAMRVLIG